MNTVEEKVQELLSCMTLEEKVAQMIQIPYAQTGREESIRWAKRGAGSFLHVLGDEAREIQQAACSSRLGIPVLFGIDAVRGHALNDRATIFPTQLACACTWDRTLVRRMGRVTAAEVAADGLHWTFSPLLCLARDTRWGRVDETFGEDPYLVGELAAALIEGYQGSSLDAPDSILACAKHYLAYGEAVGARDACDSEVTYRKIREVFLPPFAKAVKAGCATFMTAYGSNDGLPFTADPYMLRDILRGELGFDGFVVTDWSNATNLVERQFVAENADEAAILAAEAGNDMMMTSPEFYDSAIRMVRDGRLEERIIDEAVSHILTVKVKMGLLERPEKESRQSVIGCTEHQKTALEAARRSVTLLKNNGVLPIGSGVKKIAVIGANADDIVAQYGDWTYFSHPLPDPTHRPVRPYTTMLEGIRQCAESRGAAVSYAYGAGPIASKRDDLDSAVAIAREADLIVLAVGDAEEQIGETKDRADLTLSGQQIPLFHRLRSLGKPVVTVLIASKPLVTDAASEEADAFVVAFNGGAHGGQAVAETLFGDNVPSGRLPISFPVHSGQVPVYYNSLPGWHGGKYCDLPAEPQFVFGEGLSYTRFTYSDLSMDAETLNAAVTVKNIGAVDAIETVQVYFRDCVASVLTPVKQLIAYRQVALSAGEERRVTFAFDKADFSLVNRREERVTEPGEFLLMVGHSAKDSDLITIKFRID